MTKKIKPIQILAINYLVTGISKSKVATLVGVSRQTITNWHQKDYFNLALKRRWKELIEKYSALAIADKGRARDVIHEIMEDKNIAAQTRLNAAKEFNRVGQQAIQDSFIVNRLEELEKLFESKFGDES